MALDATLLAETAFSKYQQKMETAFPNAVKSRTVERVPKEDGGSEIETTTEKGPIQVDKKSVMPMFEAIAEAVVEHISTSGEVQNVAAGGVTRGII